MDSEAETVFVGQWSPSKGGAVMLRDELVSAACLLMKMLPELENRFGAMGDSADQLDRDGFYCLSDLFVEVEKQMNMHRKVARTHVDEGKHCYAFELPYWCPKNEGRYFKIVIRSKDKSQPVSDLKKLSAMSLEELSNLEVNFRYSYHVPRSGLN